MTKPYGWRHSVYSLAIVSWRTSYASFDRSALANKVLAIVNGLISLVNRTRGHLYWSTGNPLVKIGNKGWNLRRDHA